MTKEEFADLFVEQSLGQLKTLLKEAYMAGYEQGVQKAEMNVVNDEPVQEEDIQEGSMKERFYQYMANKRSENSARAYISTLENPVRRFIHDVVDPAADSIFSFATAEEVKACIDKLNESQDYVTANESKHRIMSAALSNYLKFMKQL